MRPKTVILLFVAVACGLVASIGVSQYMENAKGGGPAVATVKIFVAATEIAINEKLDAKNIRLEEWPRDRVPEGAVTDLKEIEGKFTRARLYKGEPILSVKVTDSTFGSDKTIKPGFRVVAIKVNVDQVAGGLIRPGDRVDVVVFLKKSAEVPETKTITILRDVSVFAVDADTEREADKQGSTRDLRTVSLLVTAKQAETVILVKDLGTLSLTLRNPGDPSDGDTSGESIRSLLGSDGDSANEKNKEQKEQNEAGLAQWLSTTAAAAAVTALPPQPPAPVIEEAPPKFRMRIRTSNGDRVYKFQELDSVPEEEIEMTSSAAAATPASATPVLPGTANPALPVMPAPQATPTPDVAPAPDSPEPASTEPAAADPTGSNANVNDVNQDEAPAPSDGS